MLRTPVLVLLCGVLSAAEPAAASATEMAAELIATRSAELERLAAGLRSGRISLTEAQQILAVAQSLPPIGPAPSAARPPAMTVAQAGAALDGHPALVAPVPPPLVGLPPVVIGQVLAIEPGADGKPALIALATDAKAGVSEGRRVAVRRGAVTIAVARVTSVTPDLTIALLIPGSWHDDQAEIRVDDQVVLLP